MAKQALEGVAKGEARVKAEEARLARLQEELKGAQERTDRAAEGVAKERKAMEAARKVTCP